VGIDLDEEAQLVLLEKFSRTYRPEYECFPREQVPRSSQYYVNNGAFGAVDGEILYCMIRNHKPRKIIEIGSGFSTLLMAQAALRNKEETGQGCELVACEPYPNEILVTGFPGLTRLISKRVEELPLSFFGGLRENDILFIDSSHVLRIGGDVQYEFLEIIPRVAKGVLLHLHDIFLPAEYPKEWVLRQRRFYTEQYLLHAFLAFNRRFRVMWAGSYMHLRHAEKLETAFPSYNRTQQWPGSFWIQRVE
jgi:hypothetical protein